MDVEETEVETTEQASEAVESESTEPAETPVTETKSDADVEAEIAADALATEPTETPETVPLAAHTALRARKNEVIEAKDQLIERLQADLAERAKAAAAPVESSPLEKFAAEYPGEPPTADVLLAEQQWQTKAADERAAKKAAEDKAAVAQASYMQARRRVSDWDEIVGMGQPFLTPGNALDVKMAPDPAMKLYELSMKAVLASGTPEAAVLRQRLQAKVAKTSVPKPKGTETKEKGTPTPPAEPESTSEEVEHMSVALAQAYAMLGM